jgi:hypothetical protein
LGLGSGDLAKSGEAPPASGLSIFKGDTESDFRFLGLQELLFSADELRGSALF